MYELSSFDRSIDGSFFWCFVDVSPNHATHATGTRARSATTTTNLTTITTTIKEKMMMMMMMMKKRRKKKDVSAQGFTVCVCVQS
jgi:hypothetical protein